MSLHKVVERLSGHPDHIAFGKTLLSQGKVGVIVLAGGDGLRLGWPGPKGTYPLCPLTHTTLFDLLCERLEKAQEIYGVSIPCALMVSPQNEKATRRALGKRGEHLFSIYSQKTAPLLGEDHLPCEEQSPNGNGEALKEWILAGLHKIWKDLGVEYLHIVPIDNPLADPCDPNLCGFHALQNAEVTLKAVRRKGALEKAGAIAQVDGRWRVIEYTQSSPLDATCVHTDYVHTGLFCFSISFVQKALGWKLPLHLVKKKKGEKWVCKQEYFLFDVLSYASNIELLVYPRDEIFAPLKSEEDLPFIRELLKF